MYMHYTTNNVRRRIFCSCVFWHTHGGTRAGTNKIEDRDKNRSDKHGPFFAVAVAVAVAVAALIPRNGVLRWRGQVAACLRQQGVVALDTRDALGRERFHPFTPGQHLS